MRVQCDPFAPNPQRDSQFKTGVPTHGQIAKTTFVMSGNLNARSPRLDRSLVQSGLYSLNAIQSKHQTRESDVLSIQTERMTRLAYRSRKQSSHPARQNQTTERTDAKTTQTAYERRLRNRFQNRK